MEIETLEHLTTQLGEAYEALRVQYQQRLQEELDAIEITVTDWKWQYAVSYVRGIPATPVAEKWIAEREKLAQGPFKLPFGDEKLSLYAYRGSGNITIHVDDALFSHESAKEFHKLISEISVAGAWQNKEADMATAQNAVEDVEKEAAFLTERVNFFWQVKGIIANPCPIPHFGAGIMPPCPDPATPGGNE